MHCIYNALNSRVQNDLNERVFLFEATFLVHENIKMRSTPLIVRETFGTHFLRQIQSRSVIDEVVPRNLLVEDT
jgi:hypothetical protein